MHIKTYLALGDSYSIGEQVSLTESFPYQTVQLLRQAGLQVAAPEIIASTGFTTDELEAVIYPAALLNQYDFVSLLIGVNNQYRGRSVENFEIEFENLLQKSIQFAAGNCKAVFVLSIPDWGITPFAEGRDTATIATEIDAYNAVCKSIAAKYKVNYLDITSSQRLDGNQIDFLAADQLHPSAKEYAKWAAMLSEKILSAN